MSSERQEDLWIQANVQLPDDGFYVDLGCAYPVTCSNTHFLRKRGWLGLCVDANPIYAAHWNGIEKFICAVIGDGQPANFHFAPVPELGRFGNGDVVPTIRLPDLLQNVEKIDFLSCDLEGSEFDALSQFDWERYCPKAAIVEYNTFGIGEDHRVKEMLLGKGYRLLHQNLANQIFVL